MQRIDWFQAADLSVTSPEKVWIKVEYVLVGGNLRLKAVIKGKLLQNGYAWQIEPDLDDLLHLNRFAAVDGDWDPGDGKSLIEVLYWTPRTDESRPTAFSATPKDKQVS